MLLNLSQSASPCTQRLPNLVVIGAMKCGTTSLHHYLNLHPQIQMSQLKELDFFINEMNWKRGIDWYCSRFTLSSEAQSPEIIGESSPNYTKYPLFAGVPDRMHRVIPEAKLIYLVRDPVRRILSHYLHQYIDRAESRSFDQVFTESAFTDIQRNSYMITSRYAMQLEQFLFYYPSEQILVLSLEDLSCDRARTLQRVFRFLGVDPNFQHPAFSSVLHQSSDKQRLTDLGALLFRLPAGGRLLKWIPAWMAQDVTPPVISAALQQQFIELLQPEVDRLRSLTGESFAAWSL